MIDETPKEVDIVAEANGEQTPKDTPKPNTVNISLEEYERLKAGSAKEGVTDSNKTQLNDYYKKLEGEKTLAEKQLREENSFNERNTIKDFLTEHDLTDKKELLQVFNITIENALKEKLNYENQVLLAKKELVERYFTINSAKLNTSNLKMNFDKLKGGDLNTVPSLYERFESVLADEKVTTAEKKDKEVNIANKYASPQTALEKREALIFGGIKKFKKLA